VVTGLWELLINAVEHGNLDISYQEKSALLGSGQWQNEICRRLAAPDYADKQVTVQVELGAREVSYTITDQGHGFDPLPYFEFEPGRATHAHGRGIAMARRLSFSSLEYFGNGNAVRATSARAEHSEQRWTSYEIANRSAQACFQCSRQALPHTQRSGEPVHGVAHHGAPMGAGRACSRPR
jgi:hypothetical protein